MRNTLITAAVPLLALSFACEPQNPMGKARAPQTSRMQMSADGKTLYVALADHDLVRAVDASTGARRGEVSVLGHPHRLTVLDDGRVAVSAEWTGVVSIVDVEHGRVDASVDVGAEPYGLVQRGDSLVVAVAGEGDLARIALSDPTRVAERIVLKHGDPRGLAVMPDGKIVVSHFGQGVLSIVDGDREADEVDMHLTSRAFFAPNQMDSVTASLDGTDVAVPHVECNNDPAQFGADGGSLTGGALPSVTYYVTGPTGYPAVVPAISHVDVGSATLASDESRSLDEAEGAAPESPGAVAPVINPTDRALLGDDDINGITEIAFVDDGKLELVVARGSGNVFVRRPKIAPGEASLYGVVKLAVGAESIQVSPDGTTAYVYNSFDDSVTSFLVPRAPDAKSQYAGGNGDGETATAPDPLTAIVKRAVPMKSVAVAQRFTVAEPVLPADVREGRALFYGADNRLTSYGAISCQSCHPNGAADGTTWHFAEGPRQSPALWGGILGTEPFHWDQSVPNMAGISEATIVARMGGSGLDSDAMNKIGAFLDVIPAPAPPRSASASSISRGAALFASDALGCTQCHAGRAFTDNLAHDVGTGVGEPGGLLEFATPPLRGLAYSAPYLHDGSAATLEQLVDKMIATDRMGHGSDLTAQDKTDLIAFLRTL
ncbi:MAG TPA: hypothetical protein VGO62_12340 [Myxococcota bacterium]|jgi:mono/diheme cytochrome c family protein